MFFETSNGGLIINVDHIMVIPRKHGTIVESSRLSKTVDIIMVDSSILRVCLDDAKKLVLNIPYLDLD